MRLSAVALLIQQTLQSHALHDIYSNKPNRSVAFGMDPTHRHWEVNPGPT